MSLLLVAVPSLAAAEEARPAEPSRREDVRLVAGLGASKDAQSTAAVVGMEALYRRGLFAGGLYGEYGTPVSTYRFFGGTVGAGLSLPTPRWVRVDLLATTGVHRYEGVKGVFGLVTPYAPATLACAGGRLDVALELGGRRRFVLALAGILEHDLAQVSRTSTVVFASETTTGSIGGLRVGSLLSFGSTFAL